MEAAQPSRSQHHNSGKTSSSSITAPVSAEIAPHRSDKPEPHSLATSHDGRTGIMLFTEDLRLHDNETLHAAAKHIETLIPLYCFDPDKVHSKEVVRPLTKPTTRFLLDSIWDLRISLQSKGSDLVVRVGPLEQVLLQLCDTHNVRSIFLTRFEHPGEYVIDRYLRKALRKKRVIVTEVPRITLYREEDVPFSITGSWSFFVENIGDTVIRNPLPVPVIPPLPQNVPLSPGEIPTIPGLGFRGAVSYGSHRFQDVPGGETQALLTLSLHPKVVSNSPYGVTLESKFRALLVESVWVGCLSPRRIFDELRKALPFETAKKTNIYWHLLYIDFATFLLAKMSRESSEPLKNESSELAKNAKRGSSGKRVLKQGGGPFRTFERL